MCADKWVCRHPYFIGCDGGGVGLLEDEKYFVKRMGCAEFSIVKEML